MFKMHITWVLTVTDSLPPPTLSQQRDIVPPPAGSSLSDITVYANDTLFGSEPSEALNSTPSMLRAKNTHKVNCDGEYDNVLIFCLAASCEEGS